MKEYIIKVDEQKTDIDGGMPLQGKPQELVRCKDCKKQCTDNCLLYWNDINTPDNWYCADGVRRE